MQAKLSDQIEYKRVDDLIPYARNSRTHSEEQVVKLASSIKEYGFLVPVLLDADNGIIAGHGRVMAAKKLGLETVPTISASGLTEAQKKAFIIADNRLAIDAGWDWEMLAVELGDLKDAGFDLSLTGFEDAEIDAIIQPADLPDDFGFNDEEGEPAEGEPEEFVQISFLFPHTHIDEVTAYIKKVGKETIVDDITQKALDLLQKKDEAAQVDDVD